MNQTQRPAVADMLSVAQFAKLVGAQEVTIYQAVRKHEIKAYRVGKRMIRIDPAEIDRYITEI